jgi:very-short-patch-repair endonuclease
MVYRSNLLKMFRCWIKEVLDFLALDEKKAEEIGLILNKVRPITKLTKQDEKRIIENKTNPKKPEKGESFKDKFPEKAKCWSKRNKYSPDQICKASGKPFIFNCKICNHEFVMTPSDAQTHWCPYCSIPCQKLCEDNDCYFCFIHSFASHPKSEEWNYKKNKYVPRDFCKNSHEDCWFICKICKHDIKMKLLCVSNGNNCKYCCVPCQELCDNKNCNFCFNTSFASHPKSEFWSSKNKKTPREVTKHSHENYIFKCLKCNHEFESSPHSVSAGQWCPYCAIPCQRLCSDEWCDFCLENSFSSLEQADHWNYQKNKYTPRELTKHSKKKCWFNCNVCKYIFRAKLNSISRGTWCPKCKNKTEALIHTYLLEIYKDTIYQMKFDWCKDKRHLPFDFYIPSLRVIIEPDGKHHFEIIKCWDNNPDEIQKRDRYKEKCALEHGISVIRISQEDVWKDRIDWRKELVDAIEKCKNFKIPNVIKIGDVY